MSYEIEILDTSHWEGKPNYSKVPEGIRGVITKATEGKGWTDPTLKDHVDGWVSQRPDIFRGVFHYYRESDWVKDQVEFLVSTMESHADRVGIPIEDLVDVWAWDVEGKNNPYFDNWRNGEWKRKATVVLDGLNRLADRTQKLPWLYVNNDYYQNILGSDSRLHDFPLWIAWPVANKAAPLLPKGRTTWSLWQWSWTRKEAEFLPGSDGRVPYVDSNYFNGSWDELISLTNATRLMGTVPVPDPVPCDDCPFTGLDLTMTLGDALDKLRE